MIRFTVVPAFVFLLLVPTARADLIAHWAGDGNADDSVADRDGTLVGGAGFGAGKIGQAFSLDGGNDYVSVPDDDLWSFGNDPFTIAMFVNFDTVKSFNVLAAHDTGPGNTNKWNYYFQSDGRFVFLVNASIGPDDTMYSTTTFNPTVGQYHHIALTRSGTDYTFYADGVSLGTASSSVFIPPTGAQLTFGQAAGIGYLDGRLDEIRIYDEALSASQISQLASTAVPEPSSMALLSAASVGLLAYRRRRGKRNTAMGNATD